MNFIRFQTARRRLALVTTLALALTLAACGGGGGSSAPAPNPVPSLRSISPTSATAGGTAFSLAVNGRNFVTSSVVRWNGSNRTTTFADSGNLSAAITSEDVSAVGTAEITVFSPTPGGGTSNAVSLTIVEGPKITSLSPSSVVAGSSAFTLTVNGANFTRACIVQWNDTDRDTTFDSSTQLTAMIDSADVAASGTAQVTVLNTGPGGGVSNAATFTITEPTQLKLNTSRLPDTATGKDYRFTLASEGGLPPHTFSVSEGQLPDGLFLVSSSGRILGRVTAAAGIFNFAIQVDDSAAIPRVVSRDLSIEVKTTLGRNDFCTSGSDAGTTRISNGTIRASFSPYGDVDVYSFQGTAGSQVSIETFAQRLDLDGNSATRDSQADTILELLDSNCAQLTFNDDLSDPPDHVQDSLINFTLLSDGLYFIRVRDFRGDGRPDLIYDLSLSGAD